MRTVLALIVTAVSLAAGCFLLGYGYAEWWRQRPPVSIEGLVWEFDNRYVQRRDAYYDRTAKDEPEFEVLPFDQAFGDWPAEATLRLSHYRVELPARTQDLGLEGLADLRPPATVFRLVVEPGAAALRDRHGMINVPARYAIELGRQGYTFRAANEWDAEQTAKAVVWWIIQTRFEGSFEKLVGERKNKW